MKKVHRLSLDGCTPLRDMGNSVTWSERENNRVAYHLVNAALDILSQWWPVDYGTIQHHLRSKGYFKICVGGGVHKTAQSSDLRCAALIGALCAVGMRTKRQRLVQVANLARTIDWVP